MASPVVRFLRLPLSRTARQFVPYKSTSTFCTRSKPVEPSKPDDPSVKTHNLGLNIQEAFHEPINKYVTSKRIGNTVDNWIRVSWNVFGMFVAGSFWLLCFVEYQDGRRDQKLRNGGCATHDKH